jgi:hypothetical protein
MMTMTDRSDAEHIRRRDQLGVDAAALVERMGAAGVGWLDDFLADYLFAGEPLDQVLAKARELCGLPPRNATRFDTED